MKAAREAWFDGQPDLAPERLIFIDETGLSTKMARLRGRCPKGERLFASIPHGHWRTTTFVAGLRLGGLDAPMVLDGPMNREAFLAYVAQVLAPTLRSGDIVVMDNLRCHKSAAVRDAIEATGAELRFLPPSRRTSTRSRTPSQSSKRSSGKPPPGPSIRCGMRSGASSTSSPPTNAATTSPQPDTSRNRWKMLYFSAA